MNSGINYIDLFSGIGGFHLGILNAGIKINKSFYSDISKYANIVYKKHFNQSIELGDVKNITKETIIEKTDGELPKIDLVTFGFPCQDLSIAGKGLGFDGKRSSLFFEAIRIIQELQPDYFIFENVKGLLQYSGGKAFELVLQEISNIGYDGQWQLVNTSWFLPQNRERIYFVGYNRRTIKSPPKIFPITKPNRCIVKIQPKTKAEQDRIFNKISQDNRKNELLESGRRSKGRFNSNKNSGLNQIISSVSQSYRVYGLDGNSITLTSNTGGIGARTGLYAVNKETNKNKYNLDKGIYNHKYNIRRLTPIECERLQGFPDNWTSDLSDTQRYRCLGNAVSVPVVEEIIRRLYNN